MIFFPSQVALILGIRQREILDWISCHLLEADRVGKVIYIHLDDLVRFLFHHPEHMGRLYYDDIPGYVTFMRSKIIAQIEEMDACK